MATSGQRWFLELDMPAAGDVASQTLRWATDEVQVITAKGEVLAFTSGLTRPSAAQLEDQIVVTVVDPSIDWPARYRDVLASRSRLLLWEEDSVYEAAQVFAVGSALLPAYGTRHEPVTWEILPDDVAIGGTGRLMPPARQRVTRQTWPITEATGMQIPEDSVGVHYPELFGMPGLLTNGTARAVMPVAWGQWRAADPLLSYAVLAIGTIDATEVRIREADNDDAEWRPVTQVADLRGTVLSVCAFDYASNVFPSEPTSLMVGYRSDTGGGRYRSAYDVFAYVLRKYASATAIDWDRLPEVQDLIGPFMIDAWVDEPIPAWEWIEHVVEHLPVEIATSTKGRYFAPLLQLHDRRKVIDRFVVGEGVDRTRPVEVGDESGVQNEFAVNFAPRKGDFTRTAVVTGEDDGDSRNHLNEKCLLSVAAYGSRPGEDEIEVDWTFDLTTAILIGEQMADRYALPERRVTLRCEGRWDRREGDQIELLDEELGIDGLAIIDEPPEVDETGITCIVRVAENA